MPVAVPKLPASIKAKIFDIAAANDPRKGIMDGLGASLDKIDVYAGRVLLAIYIAPKTTAGGIILTDSTVQEDLWQGTVGLVVKLGPIAFADDDTHKFHGQTVNIGDWVVFRPSDTKRLQINGVDCRLIEDALIDMRIPSPEIITHRKG